MMNFSDLESFIHRKLAELPAPRAPRALLPRIMAEVRRTVRSPWREWPWFGWPRPRPAVGLVALTALILTGGLALDWSSGGTVGNAWGGFVATAEEAAIGVGATVREAQVLWRVFLEPIAGYLIPWVSGMWVVFALLWEALRSMLWEGSVGQ